MINRHAGEGRSNVMINSPLSEKCSRRVFLLNDRSAAPPQEQKLAPHTHSQAFSRSSDVENSLQWRVRANPSWVGITEPHTCWDQEELLGGPHPSVNVMDGVVSAQRLVTMKRKAKGLPNITQQEEEEADESIACYNKKQRFQDVAIEIVALLKGCAQQKDLQTGSRLHAEIVGKGLLEKNDFIGSTLVHMYVKCGALEKAKDVFDKLPVRDIVSWTALIGGYAQHGNGEEALKCFQRMQHEGVAPDMHTFSCVLKACNGVGAAQRGQEMHSRIVKDSLLERNLVLANVLLDMYAKCGALERAQQVFDELPVRDAVSWTTLITGFTQAGHDQRALLWFERMQAGGFSPSIATFLCVLKACGSMGAVEKGQEVHSQIVKAGLFDGNTKVTNAFIAMYGKFGLLLDAKQMCQGLQTRDVITWNTLIRGYTQHGYGKEALGCFDKMQLEGFCPNAVTFSSTLKACGMVGATNKGIELFAQISKQHLLEKNVVVANALIDMFSKCGLLRKAQEVFDKILVKDVISWNALIVGYGQQGHDEEVLNLFELMQLEGFAPDTTTFACTLKACGATGAVVQGQEIHARVVRDGLMDETMIVGTALVDMYAKSGMLIEAQELFDDLHVHDLVSWNALLAGYSQLGKDEVVFCLLDKLIKEGKEPDSVTFTAVLNTCSHGGLLDEGQFYFVKLSETHDIAPSLEHLTCMIDLFCRAGHFNLAKTVIENMPFSVDSALWLSFSSACQRWGEGKVWKMGF